MTSTRQRDRPAAPNSGRRPPAGHVTGDGPGAAAPDAGPTIASLHALIAHLVEENAALRHDLGQLAYTVQALHGQLQTAHPPPAPPPPAPQPEAGAPVPGREDQLLTPSKPPPAALSDGSQSPTASSLDSTLSPPRREMASVMEEEDEAPVVPVLSGPGPDTVTIPLAITPRPASAPASPRGPSPAPSPKALVAPFPPKEVVCSVYVELMAPRAPSPPRSSMGRHTREPLHAVYTPEPLEEPPDPVTPTTAGREAAAVAPVAAAAYHAGPPSFIAVPHPPASSTASSNPAASNPGSRRGSGRSTPAADLECLLQPISVSGSNSRASQPTESPIPFPRELQSPSPDPGARLQTCTWWSRSVAGVPVLFQARHSYGPRDIASPRTSPTPSPPRRTASPNARRSPPGRRPTGRPSITTEEPVVQPVAKVRLSLHDVAAAAAPAPRRLTQTTLESPSPSKSSMYSAASRDRSPGRNNGGDAPRVSRALSFPDKALPAKRFVAGSARQLTAHPAHGSQKSLGSPTHRSAAKFQETRQPLDQKAPSGRRLTATPSENPTPTHSLRKA